ncbi:MAG: cupin domain-containing protein, partial [Clostridia bacterium]
MAQKTGISKEEYEEIENGQKDFPFSFIYRCAEILGVDVIEIMSGVTPTLKNYTVTRSGHGLPIKRNHSFTYRHLAPHFTGKLMEPFMVTIPFNEDVLNNPIEVSSHDGQEFDVVIEGKMRVKIDGHEETLFEGDSILYNSSIPHGMVAIGGEDCKFIAVLVKNEHKK